MIRAAVFCLLAISTAMAETPASAPGAGRAAVYASHDQAVRSSLFHSRGLIRRCPYRRSVVDAPRGPAVSRQRDCKEACNSIPVVLYFLQHDFVE